MLLILAAVSIAILTGDHGILTQANKANVTSIEARVREEVQLAVQAANLAINRETANDYSWSAIKDGIKEGAVARDKTSAYTDEANGVVLATIATDLKEEGYYIAVTATTTVDEVEQRTITVEYEGNDYKNATNNTNAKITFNLKATQHECKVEGITNGGSGETGGGDTPTPPTPPVEPVTPSFDENTLTIGEAINADKYGWKVPEYNETTDEFTTGVWRLFYQDSSYTYLITDECVGTYMPSDHYSGYASGEDVSTIGQKLNPKISSLFTSANTNLNIRATAWLTDPDEWTSYKNSDAVFAIGSPTAELFANSYNATGKPNTISLDLGTYGYTENTSSGWLSTSDNHGIYNKSTSSSWWLASPGGNISTGELRVGGGSGYFYSLSVGSNSYAVRPIVCIPTSVFNRNYTLEDV